MTSGLCVFFGCLAALGLAVGVFLVLLPAGLVPIGFENGNVLLSAILLVGAAASFVSAALLSAVQRQEAGQLVNTWFTRLVTGVFTVYVALFVAGVAASLLR